MKLKASPGGTAKMTMTQIVQSLEDELIERYERTKTKAGEWCFRGPAGSPERAEWEDAFLS